MKYDTWPNLAAMAFETMSDVGDRPLLWAKSSGAWHSVSGREARERCACIARGLKALGVGAGDRVALVSESRPEWVIADLGIMAAGAISVPTYITNQVSDHLHVLTNCGAKAAIVSTRALAARLMPAAEQAPDLEFVVSMEPLPDMAEPGVAMHSWDDLLARHAGSVDDVAEQVRRIRRTDTACLIYTSGTGGVPKGVMLSHGAILSNCKGAYHLLLELGLDDEIFLSFLPLSHSYEHTAGLMFPLSLGAQIYYAEGIDKLAANMVEVRPTLMTAVPRLYETMHGRIMNGVRKSGGLQQRLFTKAVEIGTKRLREADRVSFGERLLDPVLDRLVRSKVRAGFGGRLKALVSGGAPLNPEIGLFFSALGMRILQGYGQTESAPIVSCNPPSRVKMETVGPPLVDVDVKIAEDGEILVRGELVMQGYWGADEASAEVLQKGWLHTGDIGETDRDGYIKITDRKKDIIVNSGGDNISPQRVEGILTLQPEVGQAMVYGDKRPHLVALIVPDDQFVRDWARRQSKPRDVATLVEDAEFRKSIADAVDRVNEKLSVIERVRRFTLTPQPFTIENELMTPSLKIRRHKITEIHGPELEALYAK